MREIHNMSIRLFGFEFRRADKNEEPESFVPKESDDGAVVVAASGSYGTYLDLDGTVRTEAELVTKYREMSLQPEVDTAIEEIVNESIDISAEDKAVKIVLDEVQISDKVKKVLTEEFESVLKLLSFNNRAYEIFRRWYIDGRLYYHVVIDNENPKEGIKELRYIDPRKIRKIREVSKKRVANKGSAQDNSTATVSKTENEYYAFTERGFNYGNKVVGPSTTGLKIAKDSIIHITSGLTDTQGTMVLSYLHKAIKAVNQLRTLEDAVVIYRLARAPERRLWYIDVGNLPKMKAEQYVRDIMVKHKNRLVYDASSGDIKDDRKFMCFALDTRIPLLDGRTLSLEELMIEYEAGKQNWVYSCDPVTGKFIPGPVSWAGITKRNAQVVKVTFDNGKSIICTPDHKFPVWNKGFVEAKDLVGESIIPGYRRMKSIAHDRSGNTYEQIYKNDTKTWEFTHREVARWKDSVGLREEKIYNQKYLTESKKTIHHVNFNRYDNNPENLIMMNRYDHILYHAEKARFAFTKTNKSEDFTTEWRENLSKAAKNRKKLFCKTWKIITPSGEDLIVENLSKFCRENDLNRSNIKTKFGSKKFYAEQLRNHKAVSVEWLDERIDVGCITVDLNETYHSHHTYLLDAGVYTKNTMLEDYWLPRREGGRGTEVSTLPGGQNLGQMDDVLYFQKRLYGTLNVPLNRLDKDNMFSIGRAAEVTRDELRFFKFVVRLRSKFSELFSEALGKQLVLKGLMTIEEWEQIKSNVKFDFAKDNYFTELKEADILQNRLNTLGAVQQFVGLYYSHEWVLKNVLHMTDEDIEEMREQIEEEMNDPIYNPPQDPGMDGGDGGEDPGSAQQGGSDDGSDSPQEAKLANAYATYKLLKDKENRTSEENSKFKSAVTTISHAQRRGLGYIKRHGPDE